MQRRGNQRREHGSGKTAQRNPPALIGLDLSSQINSQARSQTRSQTHGRMRPPRNTPMPRNRIDTSRERLLFDAARPDPLW